MNPNSKEGTSYSWPFQLDKINDYAYWDNFLSPEDCNEIVKIAKTKQLLEASVYNKGVDKDTRQSSICWLAPSDGLHWLYEKLTRVITSLNEQFFHFDLTGIQEGIQFTNYKGKGDHFHYHMDRSYNCIIRKLSITIQLTDPKDYKGGELELKIGKNSKPMKKDQGRLVAFPSYVLHQVKPVTEGERNSLVVWINGPQFK